MTKRLNILKGSLKKKEEKFDSKLQDHIADVKRANGQPLNDKRDGHKTLDRWDRQSDSLRNIQDSIAKTKAAIEFEEGRISESASALENVPQPIVDLVNQGVLIQWRKHPTIFFVDGVDKARLQWKDGKLFHRFLKSITCKDQYAKFRDVVNGLNQKIQDIPHPPQDT